MNYRKKIRPNHHPDRHISSLWEPGSVLVELVHQNQELLFAIRDCNGNITYARTYLDYRVLRWLEPYAQTRTLRLPSRAESYGTLDDLVDRVRVFLHRYFDCDSTFESVAVLYVVHTWIYELFHAVPYLRFLGPLGTGKSRGTQTIGCLCYRPLVISGSLTPAVLFRQIEAVGGTVLIDEADYSDSQVGADVAKILNCGYQQGLPVSRMEKAEDGAFVPRLYEVFGPKIVNGRKRFKDEATESRCLPFTPAATGRRDIPVQITQAFEQEALELQNQLLQWRFDVLDNLTPSIEYVHNVSRRTNQIILPLLTVASLMSEAISNRYRSDLLQFARQFDQQAVDIGRESVEAAIVRALSDFLAKGQDPTCKQVADAVLTAERQNMPDLERWCYPRKVGEIVRDQLGFTTKHTERGTAVLSNPKRLRQLEEKYGIEHPSP